MLDELENSVGRALSRAPAEEGASGTWYRPFLDGRSPSGVVGELYGCVAQGDGVLQEQIGQSGDMVMSV